MIILLSPAKTFTNNLKRGNSLPFFMDKSNHLVNILKKMDLDTLQKTLKVSDKLATLVYDYYKDYDIKYASIYLYGGQAYKYLKAEEIDENKLKNLYVLCPLYGILNALDSISFYRLDIKDKLLDMTLYNYWSEDINKFLNDLNEELIINLSSGEFSKLLNLDQKGMITINFGVIKERVLTQPSMLIKKMRGMMANYLLVNDIKDIKDVVKVEIEGFKFDSDYSSDKVLFFTKNI